ncbi:MAG: HAD-IC family P-type ATPase, partial [Arcobacteraceae bacterium]
MNEITIKSIAGNRVRLKSNIFSNKSNLALIEKKLETLIYNLRTNISCSSIIFNHKKDINIDEIIQKLNKLFGISQIIPQHQEAFSCSGGSCNSCNIKKHNPISFRRKLIEFGALSIYAAYLFVSETFLGIAIVSTPFSLLTGIALIAAIPLLKESYEDIKNQKFTLQTFMGATLVGAIFFGEVMAAFEIIYILRGGMLLEEYIANKSKDEIHRLVELDINKVFVVVDNYEVEIELDQLTKEHIVVVRSGEKIPVDGIITNGDGEIDESLINGRSEPEFKTQGDEVFAGTICQRGRIYIKVSAIGTQTYIARTMKEVEYALSQKSTSVLEADILANKLLKLGTFLTIGTFALTGSLLSAFSVMIVMSCPCATILAASTAISAGIANSAKNGILIKGGEAFENVSKAEVFCFDKTGTLT